MRRQSGWPPAACEGPFVLTTSTKEKVTLVQRRDLYPDQKNGVVLIAEFGRGRAAKRRLGDAQTIKALGNPAQIKQIARAVELQVCDGSCRESCASKGRKFSKKSGGRSGNVSRVCSAKPSPTWRRVLRAAIRSA